VTIPREAWLLALLTVLLALGLLVGLRVRRSQRQARLRALAAELGLAWVAADDVGLRRRLAGCELFAPVAASRADGLLAGSYDGIPMRVLNYDYGNFVSSGFTPYIVVIFVADSAWPEFRLRPRRSLNSLRPVAEGAEALEDFPELDAYVLTGSPGRAVLEDCALLAGQGRWPAAALQAGTLIYYEPLRTRPTAAAIRAILAAGAVVYRAMPAAAVR